MGSRCHAIEYTARKSGYHSAVRYPEDQNYAGISVDGIIIVGTCPGKT